MEVKYSTDHKTAYFNGYKFRKDLKTGYYLANKPTFKEKRERLHCYVWRFFYGDIPEGFHIHHKDGNKDNNDIENLACVLKSEHLSYHSKKYAAEHQKEITENMNKARVFANKWHKSEEGRKWHSFHAKENIKNMTPKEYVCQFCGKKYMSLPVGGNKKFCSNNCKSAARRKSGVDNEKRVCCVCGEEFYANKYSKSKCCSKKCGIELRKSKKNNGAERRACIQYGSGRCA